MLSSTGGFNAKQMMFAGLKAYELAEGGVATRDIAFCSRYTAAECREAGCTAREMMANAKWTIPLLIAAGYSAREFAQAGLQVGALRAVGFKDEDIAQAGDMHMLPPPTATASPRSSRPSSARPSSARRKKVAPPASAAVGDADADADAAAATGAAPAAAGLYMDPAMPPAVPAALPTRPFSAAATRDSSRTGRGGARAGHAAVPSRTTAALPPRPSTAESRLRAKGPREEPHGQGPQASPGRLELALTGHGASLRPPQR
jgi:hypothetical protein